MIIDPSNSLVAFDLDDTLIKEYDFVVSGFTAVLQHLGRGRDEELHRQLMTWQSEGLPVFDTLAERLGQPAIGKELLEVYRNHFPSIEVASGTFELLGAIRSKGGTIAIITDGRSLTQRNKIEAAGLIGYVDVCVVSEEIGTTKPARANYLAAQTAINDPELCYYIADNPRKDFVTPNELGWITVQVNDDGRNVHSQDGDWPSQYKAQHFVDAVAELTVE